MDKTLFKRPPRPAAESIPLPEVGEGSVCYLTPLSASGLISLQKSEGKTADLGNIGFACDLLSRTLCDENGTLLFTDATDLATHFELPAKTLERLAKEALKVSGIDSQEKN